MTQNNAIAQIYSEIEVQDNTYENYTIIEIDNKSYAIATNKIYEIVKLFELDYPEGMLSCILGVMHFKQEPVSVLDLRAIFGEERVAYSINTKLIIVQTQNDITAIACDKVIDVEKLEKSKIFPLSYQQQNNFFEGVYSYKNKDIYIINIDKIINYISQNPQHFPKASSCKYIVNDEESKQIFKARKDALTELDNNVQTNISLYDSGVSFNINNVKYYINMASVKEFYKVNKSKFIKVPCTKDYIFGLINIKGEYITVIDIRSLYNNSKTTIKEKSTIIILNSDEYKIGILADEICESIAVNFDEIIQNRLQKNDENKMTEFVKDDEIYQVIDTEQLLKDERLAVC